MKVGTDGVLLGAWCSVEGASRALDVGTGSGLIAMMIAQRNELVSVDAIDIDADAVSQATDNFRNSSFATRLKAHLWNFVQTSSSSKDVTFVPERGTYDLVVSNPPFYSEQTECKGKKRHMARHTSSLPLNTLVENARSLLTDEGRLSLILPFESSDEVIGEAAMVGLYLVRRTDIRTTERKCPKRTLLEFGLNITDAQHDTLILSDATGQRTIQYSELTREFYL